MRMHFKSWLITLLSVLIISSGADTLASAAENSDIRLTDEPVVTGSSLAPNILVAVDDSGSMDWETLFDPSSPNLSLDNSGLLHVGRKRYAYLFPNGYYSKGRRIYGSSYAAIPPIPQYAFARSSVYNKAYFDPDIAVNGGYMPWVDPSADSQAYPSLHSEARWQNAPYDPTQSITIDLTKPVKSNQTGYKFYVTRNMSSSGVTYYKKVCRGGPWWHCYDEWHTDHSSAAHFDSSGTTAIKYFPATFYMPSTWTPPAAFGWSGGYDDNHPNENAIGWTPGKDKTLKRYKIVPGNFINQAHYAKAMTAFANWFTYYRKRNLAIRGGITAAFDNLHDARIGACTINQADNRVNWGTYQNLSMRDLHKANDRTEFYKSIYGMDFYHTRNTPNRAALYYLGKELENNPYIIQSACQRNYAILFTDGLNNEPLFRSIGNVDGDYGSPFADTASNTIADTAMQFYKRLQLGDNHPVNQSAQGNVPVEDGCYQASPPKYLDCERHLHMSTFGVTLGQRGKLFNPDKKQAPYTNYPDWSKLGFMGYDGGVRQIDDLWHATINSRGALLDAASPQELASRFTSVINQILGRGETLTNATGNGASLTTDSRVFQTHYANKHWNGDLIAFGVRNTGTDTNIPKWQAAKQLKDLDPDQRTIITAVASGDSLQGEPFTISALKGYSIDGLDASTIAYLRGDREHEQTGAGNDAANGRIYRNRGHTVLGDIVHSVPAYVGAPEPLRYAGTWKDALYPEVTPPESGTYYDPIDGGNFVTSHADREPMVYVGANDGMLHGFDAQTGEERLAFIPHAVLGLLAGGDDPLTSPFYRHRSFVDGQITTGPAFFGGQWRTMLVGGLRNGGKSIYVLDVTDPSDFDEANAADLVQWEFKDRGLGKTYGKPSIVRLHNGTWAAIFANGYNSDDHDAALYVVNIATGKLIRRLQAGTKPGSGEEGNGLATPFPVDIDNDHITDYVYAGDLHGHVWRFDLTSQSEVDWSVDKIFEAKRNGHSQPITTQVQVAAHPNGIGYGVMVYFGTGQDIEPLDGDQTSQPNSFYGIWDAGVFASDTASGDPARSGAWSVTRSDLVVQTPSAIDPSNGVGGLSYRTVTDNPVTYVDEKGKIADRGWVIDLSENSGEAVLNPPTVVGDNVEFSTTVINRQTCSLTSSGYFMAVSRVNGGPAAKDIFDINGDGVVDDKDAGTPRVAGIGFGAESGSPGQGPSFNDRNHGTQVIKTPLTGGGTATITLARDFLNGRRSWHEIRR